MSTHDGSERGNEPIDAEFEPAERRHRNGGTSFGAAFFMAIVAAGVGAAGGAIAPRVQEIDALLDKAVPNSTASHEAEQLDKLSEADKALQTRLASVEAVVAPPTAEAASAALSGPDMTARVFALQAGLRDVQGQLGALPSSAQVSQLVNEVQQVQQQLPAVAADSRNAIDAARAAFAVVAAMEASQKSGPFEQSIAPLQTLMPDNPDVQALAALSQTGAPTMRELRDEFDKIDLNIVRQARSAQAGAGLWGRVQAELANWIVVRRVGIADSDTPDGVVELASQRLAADDLAGAVEALNRLSGPAKSAADDWLAKASRRLEIDQKLAAVRAELARRG